MRYVKKIILIVVVLILSRQINAQNNNSGEVVYKSFFPSKKQNNISSNQKMYFNIFESIQISSKKNSEYDVIEKEDRNIALKLPYGDSLGRQIYRNIKDSLLVTRRPKNAISDAFIVKEKWINIDWKILNKTKQIGNYKATKARGSFRGRDYTVWFTYDIPVPFGPWKLHGLPGLILEAEDSEKMMRFYAVEITVPFDSRNLISYPTAEIEMSHQEEIFMHDNFDDILVKKLNARRPKGMLPAIANPNIDGRKFREEKTFEWEIDAPDDKKK